MCMYSRRASAFCRVILVMNGLTVFGIACQPSANSTHKSDTKNVVNNGKTSDNEPLVDVQNAEEVRSVFLWIDPDPQTEKQRRHLIRMGEKVFPAYEKILSDPKADSVEICRVFGVISEVEGDRRRFLKYARAFLKGPRPVQRCALNLLERIGSPAEAPQVATLLSHEDNSIVYATAKTLAAIGGPKELEAMDKWLRSDSHRNEDELYYHVQTCRDALKKRLDEKAKDPTK